MVKKKSFWLILLAILTAAVLAFCACGLAGCSSESDDDTKIEGDEGGGDGGNQGGDSGNQGGDSGNQGGDSGNQGGTEGGDAIVFEGVWGMNGQEAVAVVTLNADGTGSQASYDEEGNLDTTNAGTISWKYTDDTKTAIDATTSYYNGLYSVSTPMNLAYVDGKLVAADYYMDYGIVSSTYYYLYEQSVTAALESKTNVGSSHAQLVLYDSSCTVVIDDEVSYGTWEWTSDKTGISVTVDGSTYTTTDAEVKMNYSIMSATFDKFGTASDVSFLHICDADLLDTALYRLVSSEGYTLVLDQDGTYETTVENTYTGDYNSRTYALTDSVSEVTYTPTGTSDDDGNFQLTFETYYDGATNVVFILEENVTSREDSSNYQKYYNSEEHGEAIAVLTGKAYLQSDDSQYGDDEYWLFLYKDGVMAAHVSDASDGNKSDGIWTWCVKDGYGTGDDGGNIEDVKEIEDLVADDNDALVPTFVRNPDSDPAPYYAEYDEDTDIWTVRVDARMTYSGNYPQYNMGIYYVYTFKTAEMPAGAFESTASSGVYLILNGDGTMTANLGYMMGSSTGVWSKDAEGNMKFYKTDSNNNYAISAICTVTDNNDGTISVSVAPRYGTAQTYIIDPDTVPVGGHVYTEEELAQIAELEGAT